MLIFCAKFPLRLEVIEARPPADSSPFTSQMRSSLGPYSSFTKFNAFT